MKSTRSKQSKQRSMYPMTSGFSLLAGAAIGGAMMYFFDPKIGRPRRRRVQHAARGAFDHGKDAMNAALRMAAAQASHTADHLRDRLSQAGDSAAHLAADQIRHFADHVEDARDQAAEFANRQLRRMGNALPHDREHHYIGQTTCAVGSLALGAGAVYFFDPENGARRRAHARRQMLRSIQSVGQFFGAVGRHLRGKMESKYQAVQSAMDSYENSSELTALDPSDASTSSSPAYGG